MSRMRRVRERDSAERLLERAERKLDRAKRRRELWVKERRGDEGGLPVDLEEELERLAALPPDEKREALACLDARAGNPGSWPDGLEGGADPDEFEPANDVPIDPAYGTQFPSDRMGLHGRDRG